MKVLIFTTQFQNVGGHERLAVELAIELNRQGVVTDLLGQYTRDLPGVEEAEEVFLQSGLPAVYYLGLSINPSIVDIVFAMLRLRKLVKKEEYDAIEISGFGPSMIAPIALIGLKVKILVGIHRIISKELSKLLRNRLLKLSLRFSSNVSFYGVSKVAAQAWAEYLEVDECRVPVVLNGINNRFFDGATQSAYAFADIRNEIGASKTAGCILFVGRLLKSKGVDTIYNGLKEHLIPSDLHLIFVGRVDDCEDPNDEVMLANIQTELGDATWGSHVHFLGLRNDIMEIMSSCNVLVHPARSEGFGLVLAEALAVGLPVVASDVGGIPEVLSGSDSVMVTPGDPSMLATAVFGVLSWTEAKRAVAVERGKQRALAFRTENRAAAILELLAK